MGVRRCGIAQITKANSLSKNLSPDLASSLPILWNNYPSLNEDEIRRVQAEK